MRITKRGHTGPAAAALVALQLASCSPIEPLPASQPAPPRLEAITTTYRHVVHFDTSDSGPGPGEAAALRGFLLNLPAAARIGFVLAGHADEAGTEAFNDQLADRRAAEVARLIREVAFPDAGISIGGWGERAPVARTLAASGEPRNRRVDVAAEIIDPLVSGCSPGSHDLAPQPQNYPLPALGCSSLHNLARMIDDPRDLTLGTPLSPADGVRESEAIVRYRTDKVRPLDDSELSP